MAWLPTAHKTTVPDPPRPWSRRTLPLSPLQVNPHAATGHPGRYSLPHGAAAFWIFIQLWVQIYSYYLLDFKDPRGIKTLIYGLYLVEWVQLIMSTHDAVEVLAMGWGDTNALVSPQWLWIQIPILTGIISCTVQFFYAWRIYVLGKSLAISLFICTFSLMQLAAAAATGIMARIINDIQLLQVRTKVPCSVWLGGSATCDIIIAAFMLYFLWNGRRHSVSEKLVVRLMRLTVETGMLTASMAVVDLGLFVGFQHNNLHMALGISLSKLYTNALMMLFNNRARLQNYRGGVRPSQRGGVWVSSGDTEESIVSGRDRTPGGPGAGSQPIVLQKFSGEVGGREAVGGSGDRLSDIQKANDHVV